MEGEQRARREDERSRRAAGDDVDSSHGAPKAPAGRQARGEEGTREAKQGAKQKERGASKGKRDSAREQGVGRQTMPRDMSV